MKVEDHVTKGGTQRVRTVMEGERILAHVLDLNQPGPVIFPTAETAEMQCGFGQVTETRTVPAHIHNELARSTRHTSEFILVLEGAMDITFLDTEGVELERARLASGMALLQFVGGHRIVIEGGTRYIELKQGPYFGNKLDKTVLPGG